MDFEIVGMNHGRDGIEKSNKICGCKFSLDDSMLQGD
jgi:hypothetical protein